MFRGHNIPRVLMFNRILFIRIYKNLNQDSRAVGMTTESNESNEDYSGDSFWIVVGPKAKSKRATQN